VIDFRYHLVSIVAVFLALAIGLLLGATQLNSGTLSALDSQSKAEQHEISSLHAQNKQLQNEVSSAQKFAEASASRLLDGLLSGERVVLVTAPGADSATISGTTSALQQAGAKVTGQVALSSSFFDTGASTESSLETLSQTLVADTGLAPGSSPTASAASSPKISGQQEAAQVLAAALVTTQVTADSPDTQSSADLPDQVGADLPSADVETILAGFQQHGYLQVSPADGATVPAQATLAVVVIPSSPPQDGDSDPANLALLAVARQLKLASRGVVVAGPLSASGSGSAIDELINSGAQLSSVDDADSEMGQIQVAQALADLVAGQKPAAYGVRPGTVPSPAPTQSPTSSPTPSKSAKPKSSG
jgi:Copper transport outer membrane protein, MctB